MEKDGLERNIQAEPSGTESEEMAKKRRLLEGLLQFKYAQHLLGANAGSDQSGEKELHLGEYIQNVGDVFRHWFNTMSDDDALVVRRYLEEHTAEQIQSMQDMDEVLEVFKKSNVH